MQPFEFLEYKPTPSEKYLGIATLRAWGKIILKYKIVEGKDGHGFFASPSSYKTGCDAQGKDVYEKCFMIDSNYESKQAEDCIRANVNPNAENQPIPGHQMQNNQQAYTHTPPQQNKPVFGQQNANFGYNSPQQQTSPMYEQYNQPQNFSNEQVPF